jgi:hypothetical protein
MGRITLRVNPFLGGIKVFKSKAAAHLLAFFILHCLQKQAFDAVK